LFQRHFIYLTALQASNLKRYAPATTSALSPAVRQRLLLQARQELQQVTTTAPESSALHTCARFNDLQVAQQLGGCIIEAPP
jgi:hypothetical protein